MNSVTLAWNLRVGLVTTEPSHFFYNNTARGYYKSHFTSVQTSEGKAYDTYISQPKRMQ